MALRSDSAPGRLAASHGFGFGALAAAVVLGAALGAGVLYYAMKSRQAEPAPTKPTQPKELSVPAHPTSPVPQRSGDAPVTGPGAPTLPVPPREPGK